MEIQHPTIDSAVVRFFEELKKHRFMTTKCNNCGKTFFPPRVICPECLSEDLEWVELSGKGRLYAFTQQEMGLRFTKPDVIGVIELAEGIGKILTRIDADFQDLEIGQEMEISFIDEKDITLHQFKPVKK
jgi:hypothetical protein